MTRDLMGLLLIATGGALAFISYYVARSGLRIPGRRCWPPWRMPTELKLAGVFSSVGLLLGVLGIMVMGGTRPLPVWGVPLMLYVAGWIALLWWDFCHPPTIVEMDHDD